MSKSSRATKGLEAGGVAFTIHTCDYDPNANDFPHLSDGAFGQA